LPKGAGGDSTAHTHTHKLGIKIIGNGFFLLLLASIEMEKEIIPEMFENIFLEISFPFPSPRSL